MAVSKPTNTVDWDATGAITEPAAGIKTSGYAAGNKLPAKFVNWFWALVTDWFTWFDERFFDGGTVNDFTIKCPALGGGFLNLEGGSSASGTNQDGGNAILSGGSSTGTQGTSAVLKAATAGASGTTTRSPEPYLTCDGANEKITAGRRLETNIPSTTIAGADAITATGQQTSGAVAAGDGTTTTGGAAASGTGGTGLVATGGAGATGGEGAFIEGASGSTPGLGAEILGGASTVNDAAMGVKARGGTTTGTNKNGGDAIQAIAGSGSGTGDPGDGINAIGHFGVVARTVSASTGAALKADRMGGTGVAINIPGYSGSPSSPKEGDIWYDTSATSGQRLKLYIEGATKYINYT